MLLFPGINAQSKAQIIIILIKEALAFDCVCKDCEVCIFCLIDLTGTEGVI